MKVFTRILIPILTIFLWAKLFDVVGDGRPVVPLTPADMEAAAQQSSLRKEGIEAPESPAYTAVVAGFRLHRYGKRPSWRLKPLYV